MTIKKNTTIAKQLAKQAESLVTGLPVSKIKRGSHNVASKNMKKQKGSK